MCFCGPSVDSQYNSGVFEKLLKVPKKVFVHYGTHGGITQVYDAWVKFTHGIFSCKFFLLGFQWEFSYSVSLLGVYWKMCFDNFFAGNLCSGMLWLRFCGFCVSRTI